MKSIQNSRGYETHSARKLHYWATTLIAFLLMLTLVPVFVLAIEQIRALKKQPYVSCFYCPAVFRAPGKFTNWMFSSHITCGGCQKTYHVELLKEVADVEGNSI